MKTGKILVLICLITTILMSSAFRVNAAETDWANVDWSQVDFEQISWEEIDWDSVDVSKMLHEMYHYMYEQESFDKFYDLCDWLEHKCELQRIFQVKLSSDGFMSQSLSSVLYRRFAGDPYAMIQAIALEDEYTQQILTSSIAFGMSTEEEFARVLGSVELPETASDAEREVWAEILTEAERQWGVVPTGDAIAIPAALLLASTLGLALLIGKKRLFA